MFSLMIYKVKLLLFQTELKLVAIDYPFKITFFNINLVR